jgi:outer membrane protein OmpA-like peptidoglycan-associated protein
MIRMRARRTSGLTLAATFVIVGSAVLPASATPSSTQLTFRAPILSRSNQPTSATISLTSIGITFYPVGIASGWEPSGESPPRGNALPGYRLSYVDDFNGDSLPSGWNSFSGTPGGDAGALWENSHVVVSNGLLQLNTFQDPIYNNLWVSGGLCQCGHPQTYGAYFVRSRLTGPGPTQVELLWPTVGWPPEIDFNETYGSDGATSATLHYTAANSRVNAALNVNMTKWHTWGVIWTPLSVTYTVDGRVWATMSTPSQIPNQPMTLDFTQETWCSSGFACPTSPQSTYVDWVAEYTPSTSKTFTVGPFAPNSDALSVSLKAKITRLASQIRVNSDTIVQLVGYSDNAGTRSRSLAVSNARAQAVKNYLERQLSLLGISGVTITAIGAGSVQPVASNATPSGRAMNRRVVPWFS